MGQKMDKSRGEDKNDARKALSLKRKTPLCFLIQGGVLGMFTHQLCIWYF
jgi:hypothetical protein